MKILRDILLIIGITIGSIITITLAMHILFYALFNKEYREFIKDFLNKK